ncbi:3-phosphoshikimate 1-carboxyvinyltransferase [Dehalococcoidia bacterium]|nr:3-phosphoshikimate 1-carboxyvinyltransferase [Dehalococcoidia bacterium]
MVERIAVVGLGLIGGSLGLALKQAKGDELEIIGFARRPETASEAVRRGVVDGTEAQLARAVSRADVVVIATPVLTIKDILRDIAGHLSPNSIVTDTGSTKVQVMKWAREYLPSTVRFVGGHPMTGKETTGLEEAEPGLFQDCVYCLTQESDQEASRAIQEIVEWVGARPLFISAEEHDELVAGISHLPILLSSALVSVLARSPLWPQMAKLAATGYRDSTRLASGSPELNYGICSTNQRAIIAWIDRYIEELNEYRHLVLEGEQELEKSFLKTREMRQRWLENVGRRFKKNLPMDSRESRVPSQETRVGGGLMTLDSRLADSKVEQRVTRVRTLKGEIIPPGDKSISHRALILNSIARGRAEISNFLPAADCLSTHSCLRALGVKIELHGNEVLIEGVAGKGFSRPKDALDAGNSGTTMRLLAGLLAAQPFVSVITGDVSLRSRPMDRIIQPLNLMGADIRGGEQNTRAPLIIRGGMLQGIHYRLPVASAQVKSSILLAALFAAGDTIIEEPAPSRDHTERMLQAMGANVRTEGSNIILSPPSRLSPLDTQIPGDISSAAFWLVAGAIHNDARIRILGTGTNPTRSGIIEVLQSMGARVKIENERWEGNEPVADLLIESSSLNGTAIGGDLIPRVIDEIPAIAVAASVAGGTTVIRDARELRVKEADRIRATVLELSKLGANIEELPDGMIIHGVAQLRGGRCHSHGDHRLAMALGIAGLIAEGETTISDAAVVDISYPQFWEDMARLSV